MSTPAEASRRAPEGAGLRAEHDALGARLATRRSVDELRKGLYQVFAGLLSVGLVVKLGWDRFGAASTGVVKKAHTGPPVFLWLTMAVAVVLLSLAVLSLLRSRRLAREEDLLFARFRELRRALGIEP